MFKTIHYLKFLNYRKLINFNKGNYLHYLFNYTKCKKKKKKK